ncbi:MAG: tetratricopeptide repeat protein, partial [Prochloraceae cyanobacterium]
MLKFLITLGVLFALVIVWRWLKGGVREKSSTSPSSPSPPRSSAQSYSAAETNLYSQGELMDVKEEEIKSVNTHHKGIIKVNHGDCDSHKQDKTDKCIESKTLAPNVAMTNATGAQRDSSLSNEQELQKLNEQSIEFFKSGNSQAAWETINYVRQTYPNSPRAWSTCADLALVEMNYPEALASYNRTLKIEPNNYQAWDNRGIALRNLGRHQEALASYDRALKIKPDNYQAWYNRGIALADLDRHEQALASYDQALKIQPNLYQAWYNRGIVLWNLGRLSEAIASGEQALKIQPDFY